MIRNNRPSIVRVCDLLEDQLTDPVSWNNLKFKWKPCADLPKTCFPTSIIELDGNVYASVMDNKGGYYNPLMYDVNRNDWSMLPALPFADFSLATLPDCKQLLAIGGIADNNGGTEISNKVFLWNENNREWTTPYPNMPTARCRCSSISYGSSVIVAGGITCWDPWTMTRVVEVLHIQRHDWSEVEQLPHVLFGAIPLIIGDKLYIAQGYEKKFGLSTCNIVTASLSELLQSSNKNTSSGQVWNKLPDMPYSSYSINHYQNHLITFGGDYQVEQPDKIYHVPMLKLDPLICIYNPHTKTWDCIGKFPHGYLPGKSVYVRENKLLFIGGLTGTYYDDEDDNMMKSCLMLTITYHYSCIPY